MHFMTMNMRLIRNQIPPNSCPNPFLVYIIKGTNESNNPNREAEKAE